MTVTGWNGKRLGQLFDRYKKRYWRGRLPRYRLVVGPCGEETVGLCDSKRRTITVDVSAHRNDREVRGTMLHEMCHAAAKRSRGHDVPFFAQTEKLLRARALITVDVPEAGSVRILADLVPRRFPLTRRLMERAEARRREPLEEAIKKFKIKPRVITDDDIVRDFESAAIQGLTWEAALLAVGVENGLVDETGRPLNRRASRIVRKGKVAHARERREFVADRRLRAELAAPAQQKQPLANADVTSGK